MRHRWWLWALLVVAGVVASVAAVAVNVATGGDSPWLPPVEAHPVRWVVGAMVAVAGAGLLVWWAQRLLDRSLVELVPAEQRPEPWLVARPAEVRQIVSVLCGKSAGGHRGTVRGERVRQDDRGQAGACGSAGVAPVRRAGLLVAMDG